jgi:hypothetical protein
VDWVGKPSFRINVDLAQPGKRQIKASGVRVFADVARDIG